MIVRVTGGEASTAASRRRADDLQRIRLGELDLVRKQAENWRTGLAALLGLIASVNIIRGPEVVADLGPWAKNWVIACQLGALAVAAIGTYYAMRAAFGMPRRRILNGTLHELLAHRYTSTARAALDLRIAVSATLITVALLGSGLAIGWLGSSKETTLQISTDADVVCGTLVRSGDGLVTVESNRISTTIALVQIRSIGIVRTCAK